MTRKLLIAGAVAAVAAIAAVFLTFHAKAADMAVKVAPTSAAPVAYFVPWSGPYGGLHIGYGIDASGLQLAGFDLGAAPHGVSGGAQLGYDWNAGPVVIGVVTDIDIADYSSTNSALGSLLSNRTNWYGTSNARLGFTQFGNHVLIYGLGGLAYGGRTSNVPGGGISDAGVGWDAGGGMEVKITPAASLYAQAKWVDLGEVRPVPGVTEGFRFAVGTVGVNFHW